MEFVTDGDIGAALEAARRRMGLGQAEVSQLLKVRGVTWSQATVSKVESGSRPVRANELPAVAAAYGVQLMDLLREAQSEPRTLLADAVIAQRVAAQACVTVDQMLGAVMRVARRAARDEDQRRADVRLASLLVLVHESPDRVEWVNWDGDTLEDTARQTFDMSTRLEEWWTEALGELERGGRLGRDPEAETLEFAPAASGAVWVPESLA